MTDTELLQKFARTRDADAFAELVRRHVDVVYAAARRQAGGDSHLAEDITQRVFILLSQKAASLSNDVLLGGWLFNAVRFVACNELRRVHRQKNQETKAAVMAEEIRKASAQSKPPAWDDAESVLDDAMAKLDQQTRGMLVLRYFEGKTAREVGDRLGISEEAARKRLSRAIDQLRGIFARRGVVLSAAEIAQGLALPTIHAPAHLASSAALAAQSAASTIAPTFSASSSFLKGTAAIMGFAKTQTIAASVVAFLLVGGAIVGGVKVIHVMTAPAGVRTVKLVQAGPTMSGIVRDMNGKPVAGAKLWVATEKTPMFLPASTKSKFLAQAPVSDADGKYIVPKAAPPFALFAVTDDGVAQASSEQVKLDANLTLQPLGRIDVTTKVGNKRVPRANVSIWRVQQQDDPWHKLLHIEANSNADVNGHFVFLGVPPGEYWAFNRPQPNQAGSTHWTYLQVEAGKTASVTLGGTGVRVTGHVDVPADLAHFVDWMNKGPLTYMADSRRTDVPRDRPRHDPSETPEQYTAVELRFGQTPAGKATNDAMFESAFNMNPDGSFVIDDIVPGKYVFSIRNLEERSDVHFNEDVAGGEKEFTIPASATSPVDIGGIPLKAVEHHARPQDVAPDFSVITIDGNPWNLADQKGKVVVLLFWATYRQDMGEEKFAAVTDRWGKDPSVSILGICLADDEKNKDNAEVKALAAKMNYHFPQCPDGQRLLTTYDTSWPAAIVIGKDGRIVEKNLNAEILDKDLKKEMSK